MKRRVPSPPGTENSRDGERESRQRREHGLGAGTLKESRRSGCARYSTGVSAFERVLKRPGKPGETGWYHDTFVPVGAEVFFVQKRSVRYAN